MVKTNILSLLTQLHVAGVRVSLLDNYNPANILEKADAETQTVRFVQTEQYYKLPEYTISSAANLNIKFALKGKAVDTVHNKEYEAVQFKTVTFVKNGAIFKKELHICPDDIGLVESLGFEVKDNVIDLTKFDLEDGVEFNQDVFAKALVEQYIYESFRERQHRAAKVEVEIPEETKFLLSNGFNPDTGVWQPIITKTTVRVKNTKSDEMRVIVNGLKTIPRIIDVKGRVLNDERLNDAQKALYDLSQTDYKFADQSLVINAMKYVLIARNLQNNIHIDTCVIINEVPFHIVIN